MLGFSTIPCTQGQSSILCGLAGIPNSAGSGAGSSVTVAVSATLTDQFGNGRLPTMPISYAVMVTPSQPAFVNVTGKTSSGFSVVLTPITSSATLASGTFDVVVLA